MYAYRVPCTGISWKTIVEWLAPPPKGRSLTNVFHEVRLADDCRWMDKGALPHKTAPQGC
ncbi:hypothetical protein OUZ56_012955 [Daphnia magna]|uniref:Transposase n=1 Tax=Daphnia magna TaxID=35525 RepID=A0ABQ9Z4H6_9CRUS|nr:hypothetical protein OUZ56_012955 [Daphnia magna]